MNDLILADHQLIQLVPDWQSLARVDCIPGSGIPYIGAAALALTPEKAVCLSKDGAILITMYYESVVRVREIEFKGLVIERGGALVAPNETFGVEIIYKGAGNFERTFKILLYSASKSRELVDEISLHIEKHLDYLARSGGVIKRRNG
jgi:hypothetical protein